jgi:UDP-N-acetylglucosamine:LPS N-acetylglucosamine transferase
MLPGRGIARRLSWDNVGAVGGLLVASVRALVLLRRLRPSVVVSVGGYASVPCVLAAAVWRTPVVVAEQNAVPGAANRLAGRLGATAAVSFPDTPLPRATLTGNPVRAHIAAIDRSPASRARARAQLGVPADAQLVGVATGSLGARSVNRAVVSLAGLWCDRRQMAIYHVIGERDWLELSAQAPSGCALVYRTVRFEDRMELLYTAADVMVGRAGASSVAELAVAGVPSVLVPLPRSPGDHQAVNAERFAGAGAAVIVPDAACDGATLAAALDPLLSQPGRLESMAAAARAMGRPDAADAVAALVERRASRA